MQRFAKWWMIGTLALVSGVGLAEEERAFDFEALPAVEEEAEAPYRVERSEASAVRPVLTPWFGVAGTYQSSGLSNAYLAGLLFELPLASQIALELEGSFGEYHSTFGSPFLQSSYQYNVGGAVQMGLRLSPVTLLLSAGALFSYHDNVVPYTFDPNRWVTSLKISGGARVEAFPGIHLGARGDLIFPVIHSNENFYGYPIPGSADHALRQEGFRLLGTVSFEL